MMRHGVSIYIRSGPKSPAHRIPPLKLVAQRQHSHGQQCNQILNYYVSRYIPLTLLISPPIQRYWAQGWRLLTTLGYRNMQILDGVSTPYIKAKSFHAAQKSNRPCKSKMGSGWSHRLKDKWMACLQFTTILGLGSDYPGLLLNIFACFVRDTSAYI